MKRLKYIIGITSISISSMLVFKVFDIKIDELKVPLTFLFDMNKTTNSVSNSKSESVIVDSTVSQDLKIENSGVLVVNDPESLEPTEPTETTESRPDGQRKGDGELTENEIGPAPIQREEHTDIKMNNVNISNNIDSLNDSFNKSSETQVPVKDDSDVVASKAVTGVPSNTFIDMKNVNISGNKNSLNGSFNEIKSAPTPIKEARADEQADLFRQEVNKIKSMLASDDPVVRREADKKIINARLYVKEVLDAVALDLKNKSEHRSLSRDEVDMLIWHCEALGASGDKRYREVLTYVVQNSSERKVRIYARKSLKSLI